MGFPLPDFQRRTAVPKAYVAVYVGEYQMNQFVIPVSFLPQLAVQELLGQAEQEFGFNHPTGGITIRCGEDVFLAIISRLHRPQKT